MLYKLKLIDWLICVTAVACDVFFKALREGKRCITAHWLNTVLKRKKMVPPHRTLHLPFAFPPGAKPCSQHVGPTHNNFCFGLHDYICCSAQNLFVCLMDKLRQPVWCRAVVPVRPCHLYQCHLWKLLCLCGDSNSAGSMSLWMGKPAWWSAKTRLWQNVMFVVHKWWNIKTINSS